MKAAAKTALVETLQARFEENKARHKGMTWANVAKKLDANPKALDVLLAMEDSGGEPDVVVLDKKAAGVTFVDCAPESPTGRRSLCFDRAALDARKANKPKGNAVEAATKMGIELLTEVEYRTLQKTGAYDLKTSSWIQTPDAVRNLGGALFCDRRYDQVFVYHNGAESYYAARGFRGKITL